MLVQMGQASLIEFHHDGFEFNDGRKPRLDFDTAKRINRYSPADRVIYLERDPRDVMVSLFHQVTGRFKDFFDYRGTMSEFLRDPYFVAQNLHRFRKMWNDIADRKGFLKITYEGLHQDTFSALKIAVAYLDLDVDDSLIRRAIEASTIDRMRAVEDAGDFQEPWLRKRNGASKVRRGVVGGFRSEITHCDVEYLDDVFGLSA
ncbi:sulfotransferase domain-containing protein [Hyphomicrobium sp. DY-1]